MKKESPKPSPVKERAKRVRSNASDDVSPLLETPPTGLEGFSPKRTPRGTQQGPQKGPQKVLPRVLLRVLHWELPKAHHMSLLCHLQRGHQGKMLPQGRSR